MITFSHPQKVVITSGHSSHSSDYFWSPSHKVITSGHPHKIVITFGHPQKVVITSGHPHKIVITFGHPQKVVITSGHTHKIVITSGHSRKYLLPLVTRQDLWSPYTVVITSGNLTGHLCMKRCFRNRRFLHDIVKCVLEISNGEQRKLVAFSLYKLLEYFWIKFNWNIST